MTEYSVSEMIEARERAAAARNKVRMLKSQLDTLRGVVENEAIESVGGNYGKNAEERERFLTNALNESASYSDLHSDHLDALNELENAETQLSIMHDLRRDLEYQQRERMLDVELRKFEDHD